MSTKKLREANQSAKLREALNSWDATEECIYAAETGDVRGVMASVAQGTKEDQLLSAAAAQGQNEVVRALIEAGADPKGNESCALRRAAAHGKAETVELLLEKGAEAEALEGWALREAVGGNHIAVAKALLKHGASPHGLRDEYPVAGAAAKGKRTMVKLLLSHFTREDLKKGIKDQNLWRVKEEIEQELRTRASREQVAKLRRPETELEP